MTSICLGLDGPCDTYNRRIASKCTELATIAKLIDFVREKSLKKFNFNWKAFLDFFQKREKYQIMTYRFDDR